MMLFIFFTCPIHLHQSFSEIFPYSVTPGYITDDGDGVGSPGSNTSGFFLLILIIMSALRMMMMMSAMMTLEICRKQRHRPHAECLLVCNCVEIVKLSSLQLFKCSVSEYQMVCALCRFDINLGALDSITVLIATEIELGIKIVMGCQSGPAR